MGAFLSDIVRILDTIAPPALAETWDNVGLQLGDPGRDVNAVWIALDASPAVIDAACAGRIDLLVTHHPLIFRPLTRIDVQSPIGATIGQALQHRLAVFSLHTNLDAVSQGLNDLLAQRLELTRVRPLIANPAVAGNRHGIGRVGLLARTVSAFGTGPFGQATTRGRGGPHRGRPAAAGAAGGRVDRQRQRRDAAFPSIRRPGADQR